MMGLVADSRMTDIQMANEGIMHKYFAAWKDAKKEKDERVRTSVFLVIGLRLGSTSRYLSISIYI